MEVVIRFPSVVMGKYLPKNRRGRQWRRYEASFWVMVSYHMEHGMMPKSLELAQWGVANSMSNRFWMALYIKL